MTDPEDAVRIRASWARAAGTPDLAGALFYGRLFQIAPHTRQLFRGDLAAQRRKLLATLGFVVDHLDDDAALAPAARDLARRHVDYGVAASDYAAVGEALIWTLAQALGPDFDAATRSAWERFYAALLDVMLPAAYGPSAHTCPKG